MTLLFNTETNGKPVYDLHGFSTQYSSFSALDHNEASEGLLYLFYETSEEKYKKMASSHRKEADKKMSK